MEKKKLINAAESTKFDNKFGKGSSSTFIEALKEGLSLEEAGSLFGFNRKTASKYFSLIFNIPYSALRLKRQTLGKSCESWTNLSFKKSVK